MAIDHAARKAATNQTSFHNRYLISGELPFIVKVWWHGRWRRRKCFVQRATGALMEVLSNEFCQNAMRQYLPLSRMRIADPERRLERAGFEAPLRRTRSAKK
jgi:hypothetical protein